MDPAVDGRGAHTEVPGDLLLRASPSDVFNHGPAAGGFPIGLLLMGGSSWEDAFPTILPRERSGGRGS
jgi:hypothetical protein